MKLLFQQIRKSNNQKYHILLIKLLILFNCIFFPLLNYYSKNFHNRLTFTFALSLLVVRDGDEIEIP
jgi:hypothetical protein